MIKVVEGDLLQAKEDIIGHQVNCQNKMNSGVAKSIRQKYPIVFENFKQLSSFYINSGTQHDLLGKLQIVKVEEGKWVANLFGQFNYGYDGGKYTNEKMLYQALLELREIAEENGMSVALPYKLGSDRGGADWSVVEGYILKAFEGYEVTLYKLN